MTAQSKPKCLVMVKDDCQHPEQLRGQVGVLIKRYDDGSICVLFEQGEHAGDRVCMPQSCVEFLS